MVRRVLVLSIAALLAGVPAAAAAWGGKGSWEPDTQRDVEGGWMHRDPDTTKVVDPPTATTTRNVYFNGFHGDYYGSMNPNVGGAVKTSIYHGASYSFYAMLGVWKDCNRDGYVGSGEQGQWEYRSELLLDKTVCPFQADPTLVPATQKPPMDWYPSHNDGKWVREWLSIAWYRWNSVTGDDNAWDINDNGSRVWADYGLPEQQQIPSLNCWFAPHPRGTYRSTGGFIEYMSCYDGYTTSNAWNTVAPDNTVLGQLSFKDQPKKQQNSTSKLNQRNPWGTESDSSQVDVWDCSKPQLANGKVNNDSEYNVSQPMTPRTNPGGSPAGTANSTGAGMDQCKRNTYNNDHNHMGQYLAERPYYLEGNVLQPLVKIQTDAYMRPTIPVRPEAPFGLPQIGRATPGDLGHRLTSSEGFWTETVSRDEVPFLDSRGSVTTTWHNTFYAYVSPGAITKYGLTMPKGPTTTATYGSEACGASAGIVGAPDKNGWSCSPNKWWRDVENRDIQKHSYTLGPQQPLVGECTGEVVNGCIIYSAKVGDKYNLRDIDCYDQNVGPTRNVGVGPGRATNTSCVRPGPIP